MPTLRPLKIASCLGFVLLGYVLGHAAVSGWLPDPEFYRVVVKHPRLFDELPDGTTREIFVEPKPRRTS